MRRVLILIVLYCLSLCPAYAGPGTDFQELHLFVGEVKILPTTPVRRVAVGNGKLLSVTVIKNRQLLLLADDAGDTSLHVWTKDGRERDFTVHISTADVAQTLREVSSMLREVKGARVRAVGGRVVIEGHHLSREEMTQVADIAKLFPQVLNLARQEKLRMERMVYMDVRIMEFNKKALNNLGIDWQSNIPGPAFGTVGDFVTNDLYRAPSTTTALQPFQLPLRVSPFQSYLGIATELASRINLLVTRGEAYQLASPQLSTRSGGEAKFLAGGQVPIPVTTGLGQTNVIFKDYGIRLNIKPVADDKGDVLATIQTEVSSIDPSVTVLGVPGFLTRKTEAEINVHDGQTMVISGLVDATAARSVNKLPGFGDIPILGHLFRSTEFRNSRTDLVIFVTPRVVDAASAQNKAAIEKSDRLMKQFKDSLGEGIVD